MAFLEVKNLTRIYGKKENALVALDHVSFAVDKGEFIAVTGASGSGKSTLLHLLGTMDEPQEGEVFFEGEDILKLKEKQKAVFRRRQIGFVFQTYNLIARTTALANVELPMLYAGMPKRERTSRAEELLQLVGMGDRMTHHSDELSGGQKQRVAIARAVANNPSIILADEPTGALDSKTGRKIMDLFHTLHHEQGKTIVLITHSQELAEETERIITLKDGVITGERKGGLAC